MIRILQVPSCGGEEAADHEKSQTEGSSSIVTLGIICTLHMRHLKTFLPQQELASLEGILKGGENFSNRKGTAL